MINKLEAAVICWLLAFKASRKKQTKENFYFIYHGTYKTFCFVGMKMDGTAARTTHFHSPFHFPFTRFCFILLFSVFRISLTVLCHKNSSSCMRVAVSYICAKNNLQTKFTLFWGGKTAPSPHPSGPWPPHSRSFKITHNDAPQSVGLLWTRDQLVAETSTWQHRTLTRHTSMPSVGLEPTISVGERSQTYVLDRAVSGTGY